MKAHPPAALSVERLRKSYGATIAVDGVSFEVARGEIFGILGPNGAGKTTTLEIVEGLRPADAGAVRVLGLDVARDARAIRERIGVQLQTPSLYPHLTVRELIELFGSFFGRARPAVELIERFELDEKAGAPTRTLSGGQQQRLSVALALVNEPELVFLDEPTTGMDPAARRRLWDVVRELSAAGVAVVLTTHAMEEAETVCERVAIMDSGRLLAIGAVDELVNERFSDRSIRFAHLPALDDALLAGLPAASRVVHQNGSVSVYTDDVPATVAGLLATAQRVGVEPQNLAIQRPSLEDLFLDLTGRALRD